MQVNSFRRRIASIQAHSTTCISRSYRSSIVMTGLIKRWVSMSVILGVHYSDVIMGAITFQITSLTIVFSTVYSGADQGKNQSSASLAFVRGIHRWPVNSPHKQRVKCFHLITPSWNAKPPCTANIAQRRFHGCEVIIMWLMEKSL